MTSILVVVVVFALVDVATLGGVDAQAVTSMLVITFAMSVLSGVAAGFAWWRLAPHIKDSPYGYMMTLGVVFALYVGVEWVLSDISGGGGPLAVLAFGVVLGNAAGMQGLRARVGDDFAPGLKRFQGELAFLVRTFFFVYLGILVDFDLLDDAWPWALGAAMLAVMVFTRYVAVAPVARSWRPTGELLVMTLMLPRGLAAAVMAAEAARQGVPGTDQFVALAFVAIILSNVFTTVASLVLERRMPRGAGTPEVT
jgi:cell volume regulation protein A